MPDFSEFKLPDVGEGLVEAEIVTWKVKRGDEVKVNDIVVEIETAKSLVELPSPFAGVVADLLVAEGETIAVGTPFFVVDVDPDGAGSPRLRQRQRRDGVRRRPSRSLRSARRLTTSRSSRV